MYEMCLNGPGKESQGGSNKKVGQRCKPRGSATRKDEREGVF